MQDRRAAQPAMGEQQRLAELRLARGNHRFGGNTGQRREPFEDAWLEGQRHQRRPRLGDGEAELLGKAVGEPGRTHLGDRLAAGRQNQRPRRDVPGRKPQMEAAVAAIHSLHLGAELERRPGLAQLRRQEVDDLHRRAVAEELAEGLFVESDAVGSHQPDEMLRRIAGERRERETRIGRQEPLARQRRGGVHIGEVAAAAARDADFLARRPGVVDHQHGAAALAGLDGGHHAGRAGA